jgi:type IV pilus assembly protein PilA
VSLRLINPRARPERGFTLIEMIIVMLLIGVLAAIALPAFLGQQDKGEDAGAKSNARNLVSLVEACNTGKEDYRLCATEVDLGGNTGIPYGTNPGQASVTDSQRDSFSVTAVSKAVTGGANNTFTIAHSATGTTTRTCTGGSGCHSGSW